MFMVLSLLVLVEIVCFGFINKFMKKKTKKAIRLLVNLGFLVILLMTLRYVLFPPVEEIPVTGEYEVTSQDYWLYEDREDPYLANGEKRPLWIRQWAPVDCNKDLPVVVASHGSCGTIDNNRCLYRELASHGYTVLAVAHYGQSGSFTFENGKGAGPSMAFIKEMSSMDPNKYPDDTLEIYNKWMDIRTTDLNTIMDDYISQNGEKKFVVMGHSLGGSAAYAMARICKDIVGCIALESPFMYDIKGIEQGKFVFNTEDYNVPLLNIYSDTVYERLYDPEWGEYENNRYFMNSNNSRYTTIHYSGVGHMGLCDLSRYSPLLTAFFDGGFQKVNSRLQLEELNRDCLMWIQNNV